ncbi:MAG TPA: hypothetical protein VE974_28390 [Thermoanaerobaculia bacterium]|nr:hypothetical protein [Thermoanaerobaculia bacterium]
MFGGGAHATVALPGGVSSGEGRLLREVGLRPLTGSEEDWLAHSRSAPAAQAVSLVLSQCVVGDGDGPAGPELARSLLVGDRDYLMLQLRRMTLGSHVHLVAGCPACSARMDVDFELDEVAVDRPERIEQAYEVDGVRFRLPTGGDQEAVAELPLAEAVDALLSRCVLDRSDRALTAEERERVIAAMEAAAPRVEPELELTCPDCGHAFVLPMDMTTFFLDEMRVRSDQLLREIHALAFYYHWTEGEILRLTRDRRRAYLSLLSDELRSD